MEKKKCPKCGKEMVGVSLLRFQGLYTKPVVATSPPIGYRCKGCGHFERNPLVKVVKKGSFERALRTRLIMPFCGVSVFLINKPWLDDYYNKDPEILTQATFSKKLNQPVILLIDQDLTPPERKSVDSIFQKHNVIARITIDPDNPEKSNSELQKALELYKKKYVKSSKRNPQNELSKKSAPFLFPVKTRPEKVIFLF